MKQPIPFGKYFLLERVNVGGMAEVFKAKTTGVEGFERTVAVKRILPGIAEDEEFVTMFVDEAKIAVQLTHANIAQIFDLGRAEGSFYIALEYIQGKDIRAILNRVRQRGELLPIPFACYIIMKVCEGLDYAHNKQDGGGRFLNLVHRDVSPQNILVSYEGEVKLIDFGIVKALGKAGKTQAGILKGKFGYMSPEQILGVEVDRRSDVFGVGICLYELLTGERLFAAETDFATLEKVKAGVIVPPSTYNSRIPEELEQIVLRSLAKDRNARYPTALALHDALQAFMHTSGSLFSRKDLGLYMQRVFAEEIRKENARDAQLNGGAHEIPQSVPPLPPSAAARSSVKPAVLDAPRRRTSTLLGVQPAAATRQPTVPRPIPNAASVPPMAGGMASRPPLAIPSMPSRPPLAVPAPASRPPLSVPPPPARPVEPPAPAAQAAAPDLAQAMEWDDDELSTQIYDKPDAGRVRLETQEEFRALPLLQAENPAPDVEQEDEDDEDNLDSLQASVPDSMDADEGLVAAQFTGHALVHPARNSDPGPQPLRITPPPAAVPAVTWEKPALTLESAQQTARGRPMLAAVIAVIAILGLIVGGLLAFRQEEPATVSLTTRPNRVDVAVDGHALGSSTSPFVIGELTPDRPHEIVVSSQGHAPWKKTVTLTPGQLLTLSNVMLEALETGFVLSSEPAQASVFIDDHEQPGKTPLRLADLTPGAHKIRIEMSGFATWESTLNAEKGVVLPLTSIQLRALPSAEPLPEVTARMSRRGSMSVERERERAPSGSMSAEKAAPSKAEPRVEPVVEPPAPQPPAPQPPAPQLIEKSELPPANPYKVAEPVDDLLAPEPEQSPQPTAASPDGKTGKLRVNSRPWSQVFIDGKSYGATPRLNIELPVGAHTLRLVNDEFKIEKIEQLQIVAGETRSVIINLMGP